MVVKLVVAGAGGRMGTRIIELALNDPELEVIYGLEAPGKAVTSRVPIGADLDRADHVQLDDVLVREPGQHPFRKQHALAGESQRERCEDLRGRTDGNRGDTQAPGPMLT